MRQHRHGIKHVDLAELQLASSETARIINRDIVLELIRTSQPISRADLARSSGLGRSTISQIVEQLINENWVREGAMGSLPRGRRPTMVGLNEALVAIAVDIHPRQASVALVDLNGRLLSRWPVPITSDPAASMRLIIDCMQRIRPTAPDKPTEGIGISLPGRVNPTTQRLIFAPNLKWPWSKTLGTSLQANPFNVNLNYGPTSIDRPFVFNASYTYQTGSITNFNRVVNGLLGGWTISGISTWQAGGYIPAALGNGVPNFNLGLTYTGLPANAQAQGISTGIGSNTYFGTDAPVAILPVLTCNPTINLVHYQRVNGNCFNAPAVGTQGGQNYPYMSAGAYFNNDLAVYRTFHIHENQSIQFRASAFDWLNHALPGFSSSGSGGPLGLSYNVDYASKTITKNYNTSTFGIMDTKTGAPYSRIIELNVKYFF